MTHLESRPYYSYKGQCNGQIHFRDRKGIITGFHGFLLEHTGLFPTLLYTHNMNMIKDKNSKCGVLGRGQLSEPRGIYTKKGERRRTPNKYRHDSQVSKSASCYKKA